MKKILLAIALGLALMGSAEAKETISRDIAVLPAPARTILKNNFRAKVNIIKIDKTLSRINDYDVVLTDGSKIEFDAKGNWESVEMGAGKTVPNGFVPAAVRSYVNKNQPKATIVGIERDRKGYSVELSNGIDMKFDKAGKFLKYD